MKILALDVATNTGWALYDTGKSPSSIVSGSFKLVSSKDVFDKIQDLRRQLPKLVRSHAPDFAVVEMPLKHMPRYEKKTEVQTLYGVEEHVEEATMDPKGFSDSAELVGAATMVVLGQNIPCARVRAQTWQAVIPHQIKGNTKKRAAAFCDMMKIVSPNMDSRDACVIAFWAAGHCQELKRMEMVSA